MTAAQRKPGAGGSAARGYEGFCADRRQLSAGGVTVLMR
jgi:hypothetical protein